MNIVEVIKNITDFSSSIWQVHPFREGNTRTTAVFIEKYLINLGYRVDNTLFKDKSVYFRNALVRSNYSNNDLNIETDSSYLIKFYENFLLGKTKEDVKWTSSAGPLKEYFTHSTLRFLFFD